MNKAIIVGGLTRDPESGSTQTGVAWCRFTVAVDRQYRDQNGNKITDYLSIVTWRTTAENCARFLAKGRKVGIVGHIETRSWEDQDGQKHYTTEVVGDHVEFLTPKGSGSAAAGDSNE